MHNRYVYKFHILYDFEYLLNTLTILLGQIKLLYSFPIFIYIYNKIYNNNYYYTFLKNVFPSDKVKSDLISVVLLLSSSFSLCSISSHNFIDSLNASIASSYLSSA